MAEKMLINAVGTDPNKMLPIKYKWAREHYKNGHLSADGGRPLIPLLLSLRLTG